MRVLIIEDEIPLAQTLQRGLTEEGYIAECCFDGLTGIEKLRSVHFDIVLLDRRLPGMSGSSIARTVRSEGISTPIVMLTALGSVDDRVDGLDAGADDYLTKPFSFEELLARMRALLRRSMSTADAHHTPASLVAGPLQLDPYHRTVQVGKEFLALRSKEFLVLESLMRRQGHIFSRTTLCERVWGSGYIVSDNTIDVTISGLRSKLAFGLSGGGFGQKDVQIETIRGMGYRIVTSTAEGT